jgi:transposase
VERRHRPRPVRELLAAWIAKEELRALLGCAARGGIRHDIAHRLHRFYARCADVDVPEVTTLAETVPTWWPATLVFLQTGITNAGTEGTNRLVKQVKRRLRIQKQAPLPRTGYGCTASDQDDGRQRGK